MRDRRNTKGELLRDRLDALLSVTESSCTEEVLPETLSFFDQDLPRSFSEDGSLEGKRERAPIMDLTDILLLRDPDGSGEVGVAGSGGVGVLGGVRGSWGWVCRGGVSGMHAEGLRDKEKKDLESELRELKVLPLLPGLGPYIAHDRLFDRGGDPDWTMEEKRTNRGLDGLLFIFSNSQYGFQTEARCELRTFLSLLFTMCLAKFCSASSVLLADPSDPTND